MSPEPPFWKPLVGTMGRKERVGREANIFQRDFPVYFQHHIGETFSELRHSLRRANGLLFALHIDG